jgi:hypothetical protein
MSESDEDDIAYFRKQLFRAIEVPKEFVGFDPPRKGNPVVDMNEDFYIGSWGDLDTKAISKVFPDAAPFDMGSESKVAFSFLDAVGNRQFIIEGENTVVASHGAHILSPEQYQRLIQAGAEIY